MTDKDITDGTFSGGFVRDRGEGRGVRVSHAKVSEIPTVDPSGAIERQEKLSRNKRPHSFPSGSSPLKERKTKLACLGIPSAVLESGSPEYARCVRLANSYKKARQKELYIAHGYVSTGVGALLAAASLALSGSRYLYEVAANAEIQPAERGHIGLPQLLKLASSLSDSARQSELSAWELCARESVVRKRNEFSSAAVPWQIVQANESGQQKRLPGRPRKAELTLENAITNIDPTATGSEQAATGSSDAFNGSYEQGS